MFGLQGKGHFHFSSSPKLPEKKQDMQAHLTQKDIFVDCPIVHEAAHDNAQFRFKIYTQHMFSLSELIGM